MTDKEKKEYEEFLQWKRKKMAKGTGGIYYIFGIALVIVISLTVLSFKQQKFPEADLATPVVEDGTETNVAKEPTPKLEPRKNLWDFIIKKDEMTDTKNIWARIISDNYICQDFPYEGDTRAIITVRYMKKYGYDVLIGISKGQIDGRDYYGTDYITARFDEGTPKKFFFNETTDGSSDMVFLRNSQEFIKQCKKAKYIKIDIPIYQGGRPVFTFHVDEPLVWRAE